MRILLISDINWESVHGTILEIIKNKISTIKPSLVLMAGDVIGEGCLNIHDVDFLDLLQFLDKEKINTFFIQGNHDEVPAYESLLRDIKGLQYIKEISNKIVEFNNIKILGIPFSFTNKITNLRQINKIYPEKVDIILAHSKYGRRIWLFELQSKLIITGHFGVQINKIFDKVLVGSDNFPSNYAIIDYETTEMTITYFRKPSGYSITQEENGCRSRIVQIPTDKEYVSQAKLINGDLVWIIDEHTDKIDMHKCIKIKEDQMYLSLGHLKDSKYVSIAENLITAKKKIFNADLNIQKEIKDDLLRIGVEKTHIKEYLGI